MIAKPKKKSGKHALTKACEIPFSVKKIVFERDGGRCLFCGSRGLPEAHFIPRSRHGLGIPENIGTVCRECHDMFDKNASLRDEMEKDFRDHLEQFYPGFPDEDRIFKKWKGWAK